MKFRACKCKNIAKRGRAVKRDLLGSKRRLAKNFNFFHRGELFKVFQIGLGSLLEDLQIGDYVEYAQPRRTLPSIFRKLRKRMKENVDTKRNDFLKILVFSDNFSEVWFCVVMLMKIITWSEPLPSFSALIIIINLDPSDWAPSAKHIDKISRTWNCISAILAIFSNKLHQSVNNFLTGYKYIMEN